MAEANLRIPLIGFGAIGAGLGGADGYLISATPAGLLAGAILGLLIGTGLVVLAWKPRPQDGREPALHKKHPNYIAIWGILFVLTGVEIFVAFMALGKLQIILALVALALWKALLVALYYMHLRFEPRRMWVLALSPFPLAVILVVTVLQEGF